MAAQTVASPGQTNTVPVPRTGAKGVEGSSVQYTSIWDVVKNALGLSAQGWTPPWSDEANLTQRQVDEYLLLTQKSVGSVPGATPDQVRAAVQEARRFMNLAQGKTKTKLIDTPLDIDLDFLNGGVTPKDLFLMGGVLVVGYFVIKMVKG